MSTRLPAVHLRAADPLAAPSSLAATQSTSPINIHTILSTTHKLAGPHNPSKGAGATKAVREHAWRLMEQDSESYGIRNDMTKAQKRGEKQAGWLTDISDEPHCLPVVAQQPVVR